MACSLWYVRFLETNSWYDYLITYYRYAVSYTHLDVYKRQDYNKAKATLSAIKNPDAMTDYLMAIVGARTNNASLVSSSIKSSTDNLFCISNPFTVIWVNSPSINIPKICLLYTSPKHICSR